MTLTPDPLRKVGTPRSYVPAELKGAYIGNVNDEGAANIGFGVRSRLLRTRTRIGYVIVDRCNGRVYCVLRDCPSLQDVLREHPDCLVGTYTATAEAADIAADLESMRRAAA